MEAHLKSSPIVDNICVYGKGTKDFLVGLIVPNINELMDLAKKEGKEIPKESSPELIEKLCRDKEIIAAATEQVKSYGSKSGLLRYEIPLKIKLCPEPWTPDSGLVTAALKIRRRQIQDFYQKDIEVMMS